ncbi:carbohydrate ABC transporter permease [Anaeromyxobacter oryzae]|uniref:Trehalose/maltose ABC transporter permease n=1 Tax=Anaeromyxobacter oryzae TaxID=2918170 RepID=A0ABM7X125_9BACT|nr:sugar ABC transporter permease [Anaeromyxobacter oryzae]BDG05465.1 trehalose/maltose ABC transporter permease [Anaeromyxobacter oryzae]
MGAIPPAAAPSGAHPVRPGARPTAAPSRLTRQRRNAAWLFVLPMLAVLAAVAGWPLLRTIYFGFTNANLSNLEGHELVGMANFAALASDGDWWRAVLNTVVFALVSVTLETILGMVIALTLNAHLPGRGLLRAAVLIPWAIPTVVSAQMWNWMYNDLYGVLNAVFLAVGITHQPHAWTADPSLALFAVIAVDVWKTTPFMALLILAALQLLPGEIYEAARVDGIPARKVFWRVTLPLIRPALMVAIIFRTLDALRIFDLPYVLTGNSRYTASMAIYARQQLVEFQDVGYGSAASTFLFLVVAVFTVIYITAGRVRFTEK